MKFIHGPLCKLLVSLLLLIIAAPISPVFAGGQEWVEELRPHINGRTISVGNPEHKIVEHFGFDCGFCIRYAKNTLPEIIENVVAPGHAAYEIKHFPLQEGSLAHRAAAASECAAEQDRFFTFKLLVSENWPPDQPVDWNKYAREAGIEDIGAFEECVNSNRHLETVREQKHKARAQGIRGIPHFQLGNQSWAGDIGYERMLEKMKPVLNDLPVAKLKKQVPEPPSLTKISELAEGETLTAKLLYGEKLFEELTRAVDEAHKSVRIMMIFYNPETDTPSSPAYKFSQQLIEKSRDGINVQILTTSLPRHQTIGTANSAAKKFFKKSPVEFKTTTPDNRIKDESNLYINTTGGNVFYGVAVLVDSDKLFIGNFVISDADLSRPNSPALLLGGPAIPEISPAIEAIFKNHFPENNNE